MNGYGSFNGYTNNLFNRPSISVGINWVNNIAEAETIELPPGQMAVLLDKQNDGMMYIRSRDNYNVYNTKVFKIEEVQPVRPESPYVTRDELKSILQEIMGGAKNGPLQSVDGNTNSTDNSTAGGKSAGSGKH